MRDPAAALLWMFLAAAEVRHHRSRFVTPLLLEEVQAYAAGIHPRWCSGFEPFDAQGQLTQSRREVVRRWVARAPTPRSGQADMYLTAEKKRAGSEYHPRRQKSQSGLGYDAAYAASLDDQIVYRLLEHLQVLLRFHGGADGAAIQHPVPLWARVARTAGPLRLLKDAELNARAIGRPGHGAAQCIDFTDQMTFANAADGRIAGHLTQGIDGMREQQGTTAHASSGQGPPRYPRDHRR
jgi:hypothetical protein